MSDWKFARKGSACAACETLFEEGATFVSAIYENPPDAEAAFDRIDTCQDCFEKEEREAFSRWVTSVGWSRPVLTMRSLPNSMGPPQAWKTTRPGSGAAAVCGLRK